MKQPPYTPPLDQLETIGDARKLADWQEGNPDYVTQLGLRPEHISELIEIAKAWSEREEWPEDESDLSLFASVHAWRALAQMRATEAVEPLLGTMALSDSRDDDWY